METTQLNSQAVDNNRPLRFSLGYPWLSLLGTLLSMGYGVLVLNPQDSLWLGVPRDYLELSYLAYGWLALLVLYWWDYRRYRRQLKRLQQQFQKLWHSRQQLQQRAQVSSSHTDKLKLFISDKLLEYIEYDEKYLHFKSIAKEVRHNGVISFDKVLAALTEAESQASKTQGTSFQQAKNSMRYLWDLLDLSTADNMAMHIANEIGQLEELLYQAELNKTALQDLPIQPLFSAEQALLDTLEQHLAVEFSPLEAQQSSYQLLDNNQQFELHITPTAQLVGNANHLVLLLENLLKNAQYFSSLSDYASPFAGVLVQLAEQQHCVQVQIYNRGPKVDTDKQAQLFQLGFSTRQSQGHHGKGLGLYFAQQIAHGFDGSLSVENIENHADELYLRLEFNDGNIQHLHLQQSIVDGLPKLREVNHQGQATATFAHFLENKLTSIEVSSQRFPKVQRLSLLANGQLAKDGLLIKGEQLTHWQLSLTGSELKITALDVGGVVFTLLLPTYEGRQQGVSGVKTEALDVDSMASQFQHPDDF